jgi:dephospho-CoA kinase
VAAPSPQDELPSGRTDDGAAAGRFRVPFVGLTGGLGSGKSTALAALGRLGAATLSTDAVVHELYGSPEVLEAVTARWGADVAPQGVVDRAAIARHVFAQPSEREWLEGLLWPLVGQRVWTFRTEQEAVAPAPKAAVVETPLLFEAGMHEMYDATIAVVADEGVRAARAAARGHEAVDERTARQLTQAQKAERATYAVDNSRSLRELQEELSGVLAKLTS